jgi:hypothetical protein
MNNPPNTNIGPIEIGEEETAMIIELEKIGTDALLNENADNVESSVNALIGTSENNQVNTAENNQVITYGGRGWGEFIENKACTIAMSVLVYYAINAYLTLMLSNISSAIAWNLLKTLLIRIFGQAAIQYAYFGIVIILLYVVYEICNSQIDGINIVKLTVKTANIATNIIKFAYANKGIIFNIIKTSTSIMTSITSSIIKIIDYVLSIQSVQSGLVPLFNSTFKTHFERISMTEIVTVGSVRGMVEIVKISPYIAGGICSFLIANGINTFALITSIQKLLSSNNTELDAPIKLEITNMVSEIADVINTPVTSNADDNHANTPIQRDTGGKRSKRRGKRARKKSKRKNKR